MFTTIFCPIFIIFVFISSIYFYIKFNQMNNKYLKKIELLNEKIEKLNKKKTQIKTKSYYEFFRITRNFYEKVKPLSLSFFTYVKNSKLKLINIEFFYQIKSDGCDGTILFTGEYGQVPITNIDIISQLYNSKKILINDIKELDAYDLGLYEFLNKKGIKSMFFYNIFKKEKPIGFFVLTYKDNISLDNYDFIDELNISEHLSNILT